ncbi:MAG: CBS domain-containing protein [Chloroflexi bacterium]|nr:CBS domain-containing protein [Chloroflexota bacterium]
MQIILTHEQADFDAIACLLGAHLLNPHAVPVLPRRMNRNVRAFITLYGPELPFVEPGDLPLEPIDSILLVDTQSLITLKGMSADTQVQVVDHHKLRSDLPEHWMISIEQVGACTTLFIEDLHDRNGDLNPLHATLLLLGIHEDTGSLTYPSTTSRDIRAAAYLVDQAASLQILSKYLNPPLSPDQRLVYDRLLAAAETHEINGHKLLLSRADGREMTEEISSIAHKIRDLLDPDALILLVTTGDGIRLVARSTNDQVNVAAIASYFGGGGHERAAAALIKTPAEFQSQPGELLEKAYQELVAILPRFVYAPITVGQIMSRKPLLINPHTSAQEASRLMQRYGYEGYPVVQDGRVVGLLTRRSVDRALAHKLNLNAASLMEAGEITVTPHDSLQQLQRVMSSSGWGQVPVVNPSEGQVIGIVTRTDLLKSLSGDILKLPGRQNLSGRLESALPAGRLQLLKLIASEARQLHQAAYIVGGFVRDLLLERPSIDFDIVVEGDAILLARTLASRYGGRVVSHSRFGTAKWWIADARQQLAELFLPDIPIQASDLPDSLDMISARTEFYDYPTALPSVERSNIKLDLHRRDFTINTMALRLDGRHYGELYDYWGGLADLNRKLIRVLHSLSFVDDPTRVLRAVRFEQRFQFDIEYRTLELLEAAHSLVRQVSGARLRHELTLILMEERPEEMLARLAQLEFLHAIHPDLAWSQDYAPVLHRALAGHPDPAWDLAMTAGSLDIRIALAFLTWFLQLPGENTPEIIQRLNFSNDILEAITAVQRLRDNLPAENTTPTSLIVATMETVPLTGLYAYYLVEPSAHVRDVLWKYVSVWRHIHPCKNGYALQARGVKPGPVYREILTRLRNAWLDQEISSPEEEEMLLEKLVHDRSATG